MNGALAQGYFPSPSSPWQTINFEEAGWCSDSLEALIEFLDEEDSKAFIVLYDGKIIVEHYFDSFTADSLWYWASAGKTLTASLVGIAESENGLILQNPTSDYLGTGWSVLTPQQESAITVWNQLTMTTGLNDAVLDDDCTLSSCLQYMADPGTRWAYHNAPYTLLDGVLQTVSGLTLNQFYTQKIGLPCGISGLYFPSGPYNQTFVSTPRNMAKFGLLLQSQGNWNGTEIIPSNYFQSMISPSQTMNPAYGYLTWLNGGNYFMIPETQIQFPGMIAPSAPSDTYAGLGKNGQVVCASPSKNISFIRMGNGNNELVSVTILENIWKKMKWFFCTSEVEMNELPMVVIKNNGRRPELQFNQNCKWSVYTVTGQLVHESLDELEVGVYVLHCFDSNRDQVFKLMVGEN
jgi:CubicO group peptidase (beta-lactamase class C family)